MGIMGLVMLAGPALGPTIAGLILDTLSWEWIFWVQVPFLLFSLIFGIIYLPNVNEVRKVSIDILSVVLSTIGFGGIVYGFSVSGEAGWTSATVLGAIIVGIIATTEQLDSVVYQEITNVLPNYRGFGLQKRLGAIVMELLDASPYTHVCATVAPFNIASLKDKLSQGMVIGALKNKNASFHPHGIKVRLEDGQIGRVCEIIG